MDLLQHKKGRAFLVFSLYLSEGAPIGFIWWAMPALLRGFEVTVEKITSITALLVLPWIFKFLWAPLVDRFRTANHGYKTWIFCSQSMMGISLIPLLFISPATDLSLWILCLIIHSLAAATQDVAIDGMVINSTAKNEKGILNGYMQAGMLTGRSLFGGGALLMMNQVGLPGVMMGMITCIFLTMILLLFVKEPFNDTQEKQGFKTIFHHLSSALSRKNTWMVILFALTSAAAFEATGGLAGPFLTDFGLGKETIGFFYFIPVVLSTLAGGLLGGFIADRMNRIKAVSLFLGGFVFFVLLIAWIPTWGNSTGNLPVLAGLGAMYFFVGMFTTSSYALFMDQSDPKIGATQFSTYMAATNGCESWSVWFAGKLTGVWNYSTAFLVMAMVSLLSLFLLRKIKNNNQSANNP